MTQLVKAAGQLDCICRLSSAWVLGQSEAALQSVQRSLASHLHRDDGLGQDVQRRRQAGGAVAQAAALADALLEVQALLAEALQGA